jgi:hypothetical protein
MANHIDEIKHGSAAVLACVRDHGGHAWSEPVQEPQPGAWVAGVTVEHPPWVMDCSRCELRATGETLPGVRARAAELDRGERP